FVFPSFYEGFGFPPLEAMSQGSPIVASLNSSISEICGEQAILIDPYNIYELKQGIKEGLKKEKNNFNIEEKFNWERTARETLSLFSEILR
ncbi:glycosyltransferase, partial [Patescibacteria group bacterium]|nr:glycosyltransferase [Patescibacteria group bacterium]